MTRDKLKLGKGVIKCASHVRTSDVLDDNRGVRDCLACLCTCAPWMVESQLVHLLDERRPSLPDKTDLRRRRLLSASVRLLLGPFFPDITTAVVSHVRRGRVPESESLVVGGGTLGPGDNLGLGTGHRETG